MNQAWPNANQCKQTKGIVHHKSKLAVWNAWIHPNPTKYTICPDVPPLLCSS